MESSGFTLVTLLAKYANQHGWPYNDHFYHSMLKCRCAIPGHKATLHGIPCQAMKISVMGDKKSLHYTRRSKIIKVTLQCSKQTCVSASLFVAFSLKFLRPAETTVDRHGRLFFASASASIPAPCFTTFSAMFDIVRNMLFVICILTNSCAILRAVNQ